MAKKRAKLHVDAAIRILGLLGIGDEHRESIFLIFDRIAKGARCRAARLEFREIRLLGAGHVYFDTYLGDEEVGGTSIMARPGPDNRLTLKVEGEVEVVSAKHGMSETDDFKFEIP